MHQEQQNEAYWINQLQVQVRELQSQTSAHEAKINYLISKDKIIMTALDTLTSQVKSTDATLDAVADAVTTLQTTVSQLQAQIAASPNQDAALTALADQLGTHTSAVVNILNPPAPVAPATPTTSDVPATPADPSVPASA